jgi:hypothetical protein
MAEAIAKQVDSKGTYTATEVTEYLKTVFLRGERPDAATLEKVLVAALARFPSRDFVMFLSLVPLQVQEGSDKIKGLKDAENDLERCCFATFWKKWEALRQTVSVTAGFEEVVQQNIANVLVDSVVRIEASKLKAALNVADVAAFLKSKNVAFTAEKTDIIFAANAFNSPEPSANTTEKLTMPQILSVVNRSQWSL